MTITLTPELLLHTYTAGLFPMAEEARSEDIYWFDPETRGILPLRRFHIPKRLKKTLRQHPYRISHDRDFPAVITHCASPIAGRTQTWINAEIRRCYTELHRRGDAHSIEVWDQEGQLVGGLYGVAIKAAFFGESMFSLKRDASKIALVYLVARLVAGGFKLLDTQFVTDHLRQFGAEEISRKAYLQRLKSALEGEADFHCGEDDPLLEAFLQSSTQTS